MGTIIIMYVHRLGTDHLTSRGGGGGGGGGAMFFFLKKIF